MILEIGPTCRVYYRLIVVLQDMMQLPLVMQLLSRIQTNCSLLAICLCPSKLPSGEPKISLKVSVSAYSFVTHLLSLVSVCWYQFASWFTNFAVCFMFVELDLQVACLFVPVYLLIYAIHQMFTRLSQL